MLSFRIEGDWFGFGVAKRRYFVAWGGVREANGTPGYRIVKKARESRSDGMIRLRNWLRLAHRSCRRFATQVRCVNRNTWGSTRYRSFHPRLENTTASQFQTKATVDSKQKRLLTNSFGEDGRKMLQSAIDFFSVNPEFLTAQA